MKNKTWFSVLRHLSWLTQLGVSLALPPVVCLLAAGWLTRRCGWGSWVYVPALVLGLGAAACTFVKFLRFFARQNGAGKRGTGRDEQTKR